MAEVLPFGTGSDLAQFAGAMCPVCGVSRPHNHSLFEIEAFHRAFESQERNYGLVTFRTEEIRQLLKQRARGVNDRATKPEEGAR